MPDDTSVHTDDAGRGERTVDGSDRIYFVAIGYYQDPIRWAETEEEAQEWIDSQEWEHGKPELAILPIDRCGTETDRSGEAGQR